MSYDDDDFGNHFTPLLLTLGRVIDNTLVDSEERKKLQSEAEFFRQQRDNVQAKLASARSDILVLAEAIEVQLSDDDTEPTAGNLENLLHYFLAQLRSIAEAR